MRLPEVTINRAVYTIDIRLQEARRVLSNRILFISLDSRAGSYLLNQYYKGV